ncbi:MAG: ATP synthase F0 subunit B [Candidatus Liptonbacteria bacterium]
MSDLIHQLGVDWRLFLSQAANFLILLVVLRIFAYKPILQLLHERKRKIEEGLAKAAEADQKLAEVNEIAVHRMKEADQQALEILRQTEIKAKELELQLLEQAKQKEADLLRNTEMIIAGKAEKARQEIHKSAVDLVRAALVKTVELDPGAIDEKLIAEAAKQKINLP